MILDKWQEEVLKTEGNICLRSGRQVGKSTVIALKAAKYAAENRNKSIMIISATERQAYLLFSKVLEELFDNYKSMIKEGKERPTKLEAKLKNGSIIRCLPTGLDGLGIRGYTVDILIADEAHFINEDVWNAVTPMLATTRGVIWLLSTTHGREGYFYKCFTDDNFTKFHVTTEEVALMRKEPQKTSMLNHLKEEKKKMSTAEYLQEYCGEFVDDLRQLFPDELIKKAQTLKRRDKIMKDREYYLGVDIARMGEDDSTFEIIQRISENYYEHVENLITKKTLTTQTVDFILGLEKLYNFKKIYVDDGGIGAAVFDMLLKDDSTKRKVIPINNSSKPLDKNSKKKKRILKHDLYSNLLAMLEKDKLKLLDDPEVFLSLKSIQIEYTDDGNIKICGNHNLSHITEGLIRAAWGDRDKSLNIWAASKSYGTIEY